MLCYNLPGGIVKLPQARKLQLEGVGVIGIYSDSQAFALRFSFYKKPLTKKPVTEQKQVSLLWTTSSTLAVTFLFSGI